MLKKRFITAIIAGALAFVTVWFGAPWFTALVIIFGVSGAHEFYRLCDVNSTRGLWLIGLTMTALLIVSPHFTWLHQLDVLAIGSVISLVWLLFRHRRQNAFQEWAWMLGGAVYLGLFLSYLVAVRGMDFGRNFVYLAVLANTGADVFAFFVGRAFGGKLLAPAISPKKTWAGLWGGVAGTFVAGMLVYHFMDFPVTFGYGGAALLCLLIAVVAPLGDLVESLFKRNFNTKEAGSLLPGHGGFLDRLDSIVFSSVVVYFFLVWSGFGG